mgnify:CR=1 FL=1
MPELSIVLSAPSRFITVLLKWRQSSPSNRPARLVGPFKLTKVDGAIQINSNLSIPLKSSNIDAKSLSQRRTAKGKRGGLFWHFVKFARASAALAEMTPLVPLVHLAKTGRL